MNQEEIDNIVRSEMSKVEESSLYYYLKSKGIKYLSSHSLQIMRLALALDKLGLPVTVPLVSYYLEKDPSSVTRLLHALGDKHLLVLVRESCRPFRWKVNRAFLRELY